MSFPLLRQEQARLRWLIALTGLLFLLMIIGLAYRQILQGPRFREKERQQQQDNRCKAGQYEPDHRGSFA